MDDYFSALGLPRKLTVDPADLDRRYFALSREVHPDRFGQATRSEQAASVATASLINTAYRTLKDKFSRAQYGVEAERGPLERGAARVPQDLVEEIFDMQEAIEERDPSRLAEFAAAFKETAAGLEARLNQAFAAFDAGADNGSRAAVLDELTQVVLEKQYLNRLTSNLDQALEDSPA